MQTRWWVFLEKVLVEGSAELCYGFGMSTKIETAYGRLSKALIINTQPAIIENCKREAIAAFKTETGVDMKNATARTVLNILRQHNQEKYANARTQARKRDSSRTRIRMVGR